MTSTFPSRSMAGVLAQLAFAGLLLIAGPVTPASADNYLVLKERITVFDDLVRIGDLFENAGDTATIAVFRAPDLGGEGKVSSSRVTQAARQHGLEWSNPGGIQRIVVRRPSRHITLDEIKKQVRAAIHQELGLDKDATIDLRLTGSTKPIHINPKVTEPLTVQDLDIEPQGGSFRAVMGFRSSKDAPENIIVHGTAVEAVELIAPAHNIKRGAVIGEGDLTPIRLAKTKSTEGLAFAPGQLIGKAAKRFLKAGQPVRQVDVEAPTVVERDALITILYQTPGMMLKTRGRAVKSGAQGEVIPILNTQTKRTLQAQIISPEMAVVVAAPGNTIAPLYTGSTSPAAPKQRDGTRQK